MVDVFSKSGGNVQRVAQVPTSPGGRTAVLVPEFDRLYAAARASANGADAKVLVYRPVP
jgi:hypothetical protein